MTRPALLAARFAVIALATACPAAPSPDAHSDANVDVDVHVDVLVHVHVDVHVNAAPDAAINANAAPDAAINAAPDAAINAAACAAPAEPLLTAEDRDPNPRSETITIRLLVDPPKQAHVFWGPKDLGVAPLDLQRPRGSGPLDLILRAPGFLPLHTRAFTDRDDKIALHLVPETEAARTFGYRAPEPAGSRRPSSRRGR